MTSEDPVMVYDIFACMQCIPSVARTAMSINDDANVKRISILVSSISVVVDQDVAILSTELTLELGLLPNTCDNLSLIKPEKMEPGILLQACNNGCKIATKTVDFSTSFTSSIIDNVANLTWF